VLDTTSGSTSFFSCMYRPGATNAHTWYSTTGSASMNAAISVIFSGTRNGEIHARRDQGPAFGQVRHQRLREQVVQPRRPGPQHQQAEAHEHRETRADQPRAQLDQVRDERLLGARELVGLLGAHLIRPRRAAA